MGFECILSRLLIITVTYSILNIIYCDCLVFNSAGYVVKLPANLQYCLLCFYCCMALIYYFEKEQKLELFV